VPPPGADLRTRFVSWMRRLDSALQRTDPASAPAEGSEPLAIAGEAAGLPGGSEQAALEVAKNVFAK
jgi:hypothetical protein